MVPRMRSCVLSIAFVVVLSACSQQSPTIPNGETLFARHCSACHGQLGEGDGPVAQVMQVTVPNLRTLSQRSGGEFPREAVVNYIDGRELPAAHGDRYMPVWGDVFSWSELTATATEETVQARIGALADFLERIQN